MTQLVVSAAEAKARNFGSAITEMRKEIEQAKGVFNIETLLSSIEAKRAVIGIGRLNGLGAEEFAALSTFVKGQVVKLVSIHEKLALEDRGRIAHAKLANWIQKARRRYPAELFTTNYDYLFEIALEGSGIPYFDGFAGSFEPFFCPEAVEDGTAYPHLVKLWKMHGSLGWTYREKDKAVVRRHAASDDSILIYPSHLKYNTSKKQPYIGLIDRLCTFLQHDDAVLFTCGYSFGDDHINERIITSLRRGANCHVISLYYDEFRDKDKKSVFALADEGNIVRILASRETGGRMSAYGLRHAVIGGQFGEWKLRDEPRKEESSRITSYFDEDAADPADGAGEHKGDEKWAGTGRFLLPDFGKLTEFLNDLSASELIPAVSSQ